MATGLVQYLYASKKVYSRGCNMAHKYGKTYRGKSGKFVSGKEAHKAAAKKRPKKY